MSDEREQNRSARKGAEAKGGVAPQPGDPTSPQAARARAAESDAAMRKAGFGDDKGADIDAAD